MAKKSPDKAEEKQIPEGRVKDEKGRFVFAPGTSGNPAGKPKGLRHMSTLLEEAIKKVANDTGTSADIEIVRKVIEKARAGDNAMIEHVWDRLEGKAPQKIEMTNDETVDELKEELNDLSNKFNEFLKHP